MPDRLRGRRRGGGSRIGPSADGLREIAPSYYLLSQVRLDGQELARPGRVRPRSARTPEASRARTDGRAPRAPGRRPSSAPPRRRRAPQVMKRRCLQCRAEISAWNLQRHMAGDRCPSRPSTPIVTCTCGRASYDRVQGRCLPCLVGHLIGSGVELARVVVLLGIDERRIRAELRFHGRMMRGGRPKRVRRRAHSLGSTQR
jgi:hypothetical protein